MYSWEDLLFLNLISNENSCSSSEETNFVRKLIWSCKNEELFKNSLLQQFCKYEDLISIVETDNSSVSEVVDKFSTLLFNNAYQYFGKTCQYESQHQSQNHKPNLWFDNSCKTAKQNFNRAKHEYTRNRSDINRLNLTRCRSIFKFEEGKRVENLAKSNPPKNWKEIKKFTKKKSKSPDNITAEDFFEHFS